MKVCEWRIIVFRLEKICLNLRYVGYSEAKGGNLHNRVESRTFLEKWVWNCASRSECKGKMLKDVLKTFYDNQLISYLSNTLAVQQNAGARPVLHSTAVKIETGGSFFDGEKRLNLLI